MVGDLLRGSPSYARLIPCGEREVACEPLALGLAMP